MYMIVESSIKKGQIIMAEERKFNTDLDEKDLKKLGQIKAGYFLAQFGGGIEKSFYSTYSPYMYTNVYGMSTLFSGIITMLSSVLGWIGAPLFGTIVDKVKFKNGRYWPWLMIGPAIYNLSWLAIFVLPQFGVRGESAGIVALIFACLAQVGSPLMTIPMNASFPLLSNEPKDREYFAKAQKVGRDGAKTIFGYIFPALIVALTGKLDEAGIYAWLVLIAAIPPIIAYFVYALTMKGSYVERRADDKVDATTGKKKSIPLLLALKTAFTNRPLLCMFLWLGLHKTYYFFYTGGATYFWKYVFNDFGKMKFFMTMFNLTAIVGVMLGGIWKAIFKESKRCFVSAFIVHIAILAAIAVLFKGISSTLFIVLFGASSLFMGLLENYMLPYFSASADYGAWKAGARMDGISMSLYSLSVKTGTLLATTIRTAVLMAANLDGIKGYKTVAEIPAADLQFFVEKASPLWSWYPLGIAVVALLILMFGVNLNDERIAAINKDLAEGKTKATSDLKF